MAQVQQRALQDLTFAEQKGDQQPADAVISVAANNGF
jgi:hypothetical protein